MIKNITIFCMFLCFWPLSSLGFWGAISSCITSPCNCGDSNSTKYETWNGVTYDRGKKNHLCPPWNKNGGRNNNTCLVREIDADGTSAPGFPDSGIPYYENLCGEETPESNYFNPKIRVRGQQCNAVACWTTSTTLNWDGDCVVLAGGYGLPLHRMCARIALPRDDIKNLPADPNYQVGKHLNFEGAVENDKPIYGSDGNLLVFNPPKLCLYNDPSFFSITDGFDLMDLDPGRQSFHRTSELHPVIKVIKFFVDAGITLAQSPIELLKSLINVMDSDEDGQNIGNKLLNSTLSFIGKIIDWIGEAIIALLNEVGQLNRVVDSKNYGCVNLPLGPMPPPYCEKVSPFNQKATIYNICSKDPEGNLLPSTSNKPCVVSSLNNNFINNSIRVGYETLVPLCRDGENPLITDSCVDIKNLGIFVSASVMHTSTAYRDLIKHCDIAAPGAPCINTMLPNTCSVSSNGCEDGFRIVYGERLGNRLNAKSYFNDELNDCPSDSSSTCQEIWGVDMGEFIDISLSFPSLQFSSDISPLTTNFNLTDNNANNSSFYASIVRVPGFNSNYSFTQESNQFCVFDNDSVVGCTKRVEQPSVQVYNCNDLPGINCNSTYFAPKFIVSYSDGNDSTSAIIEPLSVYSSTSSFNSFVNLAGVDFESFVTDDDFITKPFSGEKSPTPSSLLGVYKNDILPIVGQEVNNSAVYLTGLEYINGSYHLGGKYSCLSDAGTKRCPENIEMCVLTKLLNKDVVKCSVFASKSSVYGGLKLCTSEQESCNIIDSISKIDGSGDINIRACPGQVKCYESDVELCKISNDPSDRYEPSASLGNILSEDQYYDPSSSSSYSASPGGLAANYDADQYGLRNKTSVELGLCTTIPQPTCQAQANYSIENGYAYWPETQVGEQATGSCMPGWIPTHPLKRYCIPFPQTQTFDFEPIYRIKNDGSGDAEHDMRCVQLP